MRTVFAGGRVFDGTGAGVAEADVAVVDGQIVEVGVGLDGDEQVDVAGSTLLPGLFDTHVHVMFGHVDVWRLMQEPFSYRFYDAIRNLEATLRIGITTVRDAGGADLGVKRALAEGIVRRAAVADLDHDAEPDGWPRRRLAPLGRASRDLSCVSGRSDLDRRRAGRDPAEGARARARRRRGDQDRDVRRGSLPDRQAAAARLRRRGDRGDRRRGACGGTLGHVACPVDGGDQERRPRGRALDRARHLPRRRGDPAHARPRRVPRADACRAAGSDQGGRGGCGHPRGGGEQGARGDRRAPRLLPPRCRSRASRWRWVPTREWSRTARTSTNSS